MNSAGNRSRLRRTAWFSTRVWTPYRSARSASIITLRPRTVSIRFSSDAATSSAARDFFGPIAPPDTRFGINRHCGAIFDHDGGAILEQNPDVGTCLCAREAVIETILSWANPVRIAGLAFVCALLSACAGPRPAAEPPAFLFKDDAFAAPDERFAASDLFALNEQMRRFLAHDIAVQLRSSGPTNGLIEALYSKNQLKLAYDAAKTRNAAEAFNARAGNCLSMVIMTAAFAKELGLPVEY